MSGPRKFTFRIGGNALSTENQNNIDYVDVVYNEVDRPLTTYPEQMTRHLFERFSLKKNDKILDVGCGRGEFLNGFISCEMKGYGVDRSMVAKRYVKSAEIRTADLEKEKIPYEDNFFDVVYSKSVIEHFYYPENLVSEIYRVLKPGGVVITMCPDWEYNVKNYFEDFTHRTPFTLVSLRDIQIMHGLEEVMCERFIQLPIVWKYPFIKFFSTLVRWLAPTSLKSSSKFIRFSKEIMLLSYSKKPIKN